MKKESNSSSREDYFETNDLVFAKLTGHPDWPAFVKKIDNYEDKIEVVFIDEFNTAYLDKVKIKKFSEENFYFLKSKSRKKKRFLKCLKIAHDIFLEKIDKDSYIDRRNREINSRKHKKLKNSKISSLSGNSNLSSYNQERKNSYRESLSSSQDRYKFNNSKEKVQKITPIVVNNGFMQNEKILKDNLFHRKKNKYHNLRTKVNIANDVLQVIKGNKRRKLSKNTNNLQIVKQIISPSKNVSKINEKDKYLNIGFSKSLNESGGKKIIINSLNTQLNKYGKQSENNKINNNNFNVNKSKLDKGECKEKALHLKNFPKKNVNDRDSENFVIKNKLRNLGSTINNFNKNSNNSTTLNKINKNEKKNEGINFTLCLEEDKKTKISANLKKNLTLSFEFNSDLSLDNKNLIGKKRKRDPSGKFLKEQSETSLYEGDSDEILSDDLKNKLPKNYNKRQIIAKSKEKINISKSNINKHIKINNKKNKKIINLGKNNYNNSVNKKIMSFKKTKKNYIKNSSKYKEAKKKINQSIIANNRLTLDSRGRFVVIRDENLNIQNNNNQNLTNDLISNNEFTNLQNIKQTTFNSNNKFNLENFNANDKINNIDNINSRNLNEKALGSNSGNLDDSKLLEDSMSIYSNNHENKNEIGKDQNIFLINENINNKIIEEIESIPKENKDSEDNYDGINIRINSSLKTEEQQSLDSEDNSELSDNEQTNLNDSITETFSDIYNKQSRNQLLDFKGELIQFLLEYEAVLKNIYKKNIDKEMLLDLDKITSIELIEEKELLEEKKSNKIYEVEDFYMKNLENKIESKKESLNLEKNKETNVLEVIASVNTNNVDIIYDGNCTLLDKPNILNSDERLIKSNLNENYFININSENNKIEEESKFSSNKIEKLEAEIGNKMEIECNVKKDYNEEECSAILNDDEFVDDNDMNNKKINGIEIPMNSKKIKDTNENFLLKENSQDLEIIQKEEKIKNNIQIELGFPHDMSNDHFERHNILSNHLHKNKENDDSFNIKIANNKKIKNKEFKSIIQQKIKNSQDQFYKKQEYDFFKYFNDNVDKLCSIIRKQFNKNLFLEKLINLEDFELICINLDLVNEISFIFYPLIFYGFLDYNNTKLLTVAISQIDLFFNTLKFEESIMIICNQIKYEKSKTFELERYVVNINLELENYFEEKPEFLLSVLKYKFLIILRKIKYLLECYDRCSYYQMNKMKKYFYLYEFFKKINLQIFITQYQNLLNLSLGEFHEKLIEGKFFTEENFSLIDKIKISGKKQLLDDHKNLRLFIEKFSQKVRLIKYKEFFKSFIFY